MCRKHSKNLSCRYENKGSNFPHLIWSQNSHIKFFGGLLFDFKYSVFEQLRPNSTIRYSVFVHFQKPNNSVFGIRKIFKNRIIRYSVHIHYSVQLCLLPNIQHFYVQRPYADNSLRFIDSMMVVNDEYKHRSEEDGVFGTLYEGFIKHQYTVDN